jgi:DNA-binding transcriptional MerR regulator
MVRVIDASRQLGVSADWLRRLERKGIIPRPPRDRNGYRRYTPELVNEIRSILFRKPTCEK